MEESVLMQQIEFAQENERLKEQIAQLQEEADHMTRVIKMATSLRFHLMPVVYPAFPDYPRIDIYADQIGLAQVGGDFFDYFRVDSNHIGIVIADIFDGGNAAALYMVAFKLFMSGEMGMGFSVDRIMEVVNNRLVKANEEDLCLSAWFGIYEESTGIIRAVNAGHESPLLRTKDGVGHCKGEKISYLLAVAEGMKYDSYEIHLEPGDMLLLYTDGVTNAMNADGEEFDENKIAETFLKIEASSADEVVGDMQGELMSFIGEETLSDDATFLCLIRKEA